jgi:hypothetical protein
VPIADVRRAGAAVLRGRPTKRTSVQQHALRPPRSAWDESVTTASGAAASWCSLDANGRTEPRPLGARTDPKALVPGAFKWKSLSALAHRRL